MEGDLERTQPPIPVGMGPIDEGRHLPHTTDPGTGIPSSSPVAQPVLAMSEPDMEATPKAS
jgi:hypothetical protein